mgnify:CR=1 FL=1
MGITLQNEKIIDRWSMIIENEQKQNEYIYLNTEDYKKGVNDA